MADLSRVRFFWRAIWADIKQSRRWKIVTLSYAVLGVIRFGLWIVTKWSPAQLIAPWSGKATAIFILAFICLGLVLALIAVVDGARRVHLEAIAPLNATIEGQEWLVEIAGLDRENLGAGIAIIECEASLDLECRHPFAEFTFHFFNGSVFPISIEMELDGHISFSDGVNPRKLEDKPDKLKSKSFKDTREDHARLASGEFTIRQRFSPDDVAFISTVRSYRDGYFIFDKLAVSVRGYGENIQAARLPMERVRPRLKHAFREDASALEAKRKAHDARIHALILARGISAQVYQSLDRTEHRSEGTVMDCWEKDTIEALRDGYDGYDEARSLFESLSSKYPIDEANISDQRRWVGDFLERLRKRIDEERHDLKA